MTSVLIAGLSGRALAASARRAGYTPYVVDAFGDDDTRAMAEQLITLPSASTAGFRSKPLRAALADLHDHCASDCVGLVLGVGFEDRPQLVATLARDYSIVGCSHNSIQQSKDLPAIYTVAKRCGIAMAETQHAPPADTRGWLVKRIGGSGGGHVRYADQQPQSPSSARRTIVQRYCPPALGETAAVTSLLAVGHDDDLRIIGVSHQWCAPTSNAPFRFGGVVGPVDIDAATRAAMISAARDLYGELVLVGLVSFDFVVSASGPVLIEINPRPGITLDVFDDAQGGLFADHVAAHRSDPAARFIPPTHPRAAAYLYADQGSVVIPAIDWPDWAADRPAAGSSIPQHAPIATVFADAATPERAEQICRRRLGLLRDMIYAGVQQETSSP